MKSIQKIIIDKDKRHNFFLEKVFLIETREGSIFNNTQKIGIC